MFNHHVGKKETKVTSRLTIDARESTLNSKAKTKTGGIRENETTNQRAGKRVRPGKSTAE
jgi:hypothetical protein